MTKIGLEIILLTFAMAIVVIAIQYCRAGI